MAENKNKLSRKEFFRIGGSTVAGLGILGVAGNHLYKMLAHPEQVFYGDNQSIVLEKRNALPSPYRKIAAFKPQGTVSAIEMLDNSVIVASEHTVATYNLAGEHMAEFRAEELIRDIAVYDKKIYLLHPTKISAYSTDGQQLSSWEACSPESDYCQMTVFDGGVL